MPGKGPVHAVQQGVRQLERLGDVAAVSAGLNAVAPGDDLLAARQGDGEAELAAGLARHHGARGPVDRASAVAPDVTAEPRPGPVLAGAGEPLSLEGLRAELADPGDVADQIPDLAGGRCHMNHHRVAHEMRIELRDVASTAPGRRG